MIDQMNGLDMAPMMPGYRPQGLGADWGSVASGSRGTPFGSMGGANNNPASYSGGAGKGGGNGGITPQSPNPYMPQGLGRFQGGYQVPRVANAFTNYQPQVMTGGLFSGIPQYNPNPQPIMGMSGAMMSGGMGPGSGATGIGGSGTGANGTGTGGEGPSVGGPGIGESGVSGGGASPADAGDGGGGGGGGK